MSEVVSAVVTNKVCFSSVFMASIEPKILADAPIEMATSIAAVLSRKSESQSACSSTEPQRTNGNSPVSLPVFAYHNPPPIEFGCIPMVRRRSGCFVAREIVVQNVLRNISKLFSQEMIQCMSLPATEMCQSEADILNDLSINHYKQEIVASYIFSQGDDMLRLEDVQNLVTYFYACRNLIFCGNTSLFGFIRINGHDEVPFVWNENCEQKLVPLFYFEGMDSKVIQLEDPLKICYFKFCFKMQKIRQDLYKNNCLKAVDFKNVESLFPVGSTFELCCPTNFNQELLALEIQTASPVSGKRQKRPAEACTQAAISRADSPVREELIQTTNHWTEPQVVITEINPGNQDVRINFQESTRQHDVNPQSLATITLKRGPKQAVGIRRIEPPQAQKGVHVIPAQKQTDNGFKNYIGTNTIQQFQRPCVSALSATVTNLHHIFDANHPNEEHFISNVPLRSPQVAASPGAQQTSPFMTAGTETIERYSQSNNFGPREPLRQAGEHYTSQQMYTDQFTNSKRHQVSDGTNVPSHANSCLYVAEDPSIYKSQNYLNLAESSGVWQQNQPNYSSLGSAIKDLVAERARLNLTLQGHKQEILRLQKRKHQQLKQLQKNPTPCETGSFVTSRGVPNASNSTPFTYQHRCASSNLAGVQNQSMTDINVAMTENTALTNTARTSSAVTTDKIRAQSRTNEIKLNISVPEHVLNIDTYRENYTIKDFTIGFKYVLGIRMSLLTNVFLINLSQLRQRVVAATCSDMFERFMLNFKTFYGLNHVQEEFWKEAAQKRKLRFYGFFRNVFVEYNEAMSLLTGFEEGVRNNLHVN